MAQHYEINPDQRGLALRVANRALRVANGLATARPGNVFIPNKGDDGMTDGTGTWIGSGDVGNGGVAPWIGDTTPPGRPSGITCSSAWGTLYVNWDGTLEGGVPADFAYVSVLVDGAEIARMVEAGTAVREDLENGATVQVTAVAYDAARDRNGNPAPNASEAFGPVSVQISDERAEIDAEVEEIKGEMEQAAQDAADAKEAAAEASSKADAAADKADSYQSQIDDVTATVNGVEQEVAGFSSQIQGAVEDATQALTAATEASQGLEGFKTTVSQTYETKSDADAAMAQEVLDRNSAIEQSAGEILSTVSQNYVDNETGETLATKAEVSQTASQIKQEVSEEYQVKGDYLTEDEAASSYASKSELTQTADSIKAEVAQDYQTKAGMSAYATNSSVEQTASEIESNVAATYQTKAGMSSYATNSSVTQTANSIKQEVAAEYTTKEEFEGLEIGGTNLSLGTSDAIVYTPRAGETYYLPAGKPANSDYGFELISEGGAFCLSFDYEAEGVPSATQLAYSLKYSSTSYGALSLIDGSWPTMPTGASAGHVSIVFEPTSAQMQYGTAWLLSGLSKTKDYSGMTVAVRNFKLEKGNRATDWSPAPEDMLSTSDAQATYATKTSLQQTEGSILSSVESEYQSKDGMSSYATKSYVDQQDSSIKSTVSSVQTTANNALSKASTVEQTAEGLEVTLTSTTTTANNALSKANSAASAASTAQSTASSAATAAAAANKVFYANSTTAAATKAKTATVSGSGFALVVGVTVSVRFQYANTANSPTLNVNSTGAKPIVSNGTATPTADLTWNAAWATVTFVYDGSQWRISGDNSIVKANSAQSTANTANSTANAAKTAAANAQTAANNAAKTATNYLKFDSSGLVVGNLTGTLTGNTQITSSGVSIRNGSSVLASFSANEIKLGNNSDNSRVTFGSGGAHVGIDPTNFPNQTYMDAAQGARVCLNNNVELRSSISGSYGSNTVLYTHVYEYDSWVYAYHKSNNVSSTHIISCAEANRLLWSGTLDVGGSVTIPNLMRWSGVLLGVPCGFSNTEVEAYVPIYLRSDKTLMMGLGGGSTDTDLRIASVRMARSGNTLTYSKGRLMQLINGAYPYEIRAMPILEILGLY